MKRFCFRTVFLLLSVVFFHFGFGQNTDKPLSDSVYVEKNSPLFENMGDKIIYRVENDVNVQGGTVSDALQSVPGVKVDTEGKVNLRGVSEVEIWINDQPSHFDSESLKNYLQQFPASAISKIEVITNPSSRYTSKTDTGIVNIITKDQENRKQYLSLGLQANTSPNVSPSLSYIWSNDKISLNANLKANFARINSSTNGFSYSFVNDSLGQIDTANYMISSQRSMELEQSANLSLKFDYRINLHNSLSAYLNYNPNKGNSTAFDSTYRHEFIDDIGEYRYSTSDKREMSFSSAAAGLYFQHRFPQAGHNLSLSINSSLDDGCVTNYKIRKFTNQPERDRDIIKEDQFTDIGWDAKIEYNLPYSKNGEIYVAFSQIFDPDNNICNYDTLVPEGYQRDSLRSEHRLFGSNHSSGLFILEQRFGNFIIKPGVCLEYVMLQAEYIDTPEFNTSKGFGGIRPSLHLSYRTKSMHNFGVSYTRKSVFPYVRYITDRILYEEDSYSIGNPSLKPTFTNVFEGNWTKYWEKFGSIGLTAYYRNSSNTVNYVSDVAYSEVWGRAVVFQQPVNLGQYYDAGCEMNMAYRPNSMFNLRFYANLYNSYIETYYDKLGEDVVKSSLLSYSFRMNFWTKLWNALEVHASAYYSSPTQTLFALSKTAYGIDCGLRADFLQNRLSVLLNANDVFNWNKEDNYTYNPYYISYSSYKENSRYLSMEVIFRFGKIEDEKMNP